MVGTCRDILEQGSVDWVHIAFQGNGASWHPNGEQDLQVQVSQFLKGVWDLQWHCRKSQVLHQGRRAQELQIFNHKRGGLRGAAARWKRGKRDGDSANEDGGRYWGLPPHRLLIQQVLLPPARHHRRPRELPPGQDKDQKHGDRLSPQVDLRNWHNDQDWDLNPCQVLGNGRLSW